MSWRGINLKPDILFLLVDCLRADYCQKQASRSAGFMQYLFRSGTSFLQAISVTSFTSPCVASILTGVYPFVHGVEWFGGNKVNPTCKNLAEILHDSGYTTCALVTGPLLPELGLEKGFDFYEHRDEEDNLYSGFKVRLESHIENIRKPWFMFVHLWELHYPIYLPKDMSRKYSLSLNKYEKAVASLDDELSTILKKLDLDRTIVVLHSDHGERLPTSYESIPRNLIGLFREHLFDPLVWIKLSRKLFQLFPRLTKKQGHGFHLYDPLVRVPLFFTGPGFPKNRVIRQQISQIDILPTLLDAIGLPIDHLAEVQGRSLIPVINNDGELEKAVYLGPAGMFDTYGPQRDEWIEGLRTPKWKYISRFSTGVPVELYDLENDPNEVYNLIEKEKNIVQKFKKELKELKSKACAERLKMTQVEKERIKERLKALGYI